MVRGVHKGDRHDSSTQTVPSRKPTRRLYRGVGDGNESTWTPIGTAWPNQDGQGFSITCDAIPLTDRVVMRAITEKVKGR